MLWENLGQDDLAFNDLDRKLVAFVDFEVTEIVGLEVDLQDSLLINLRPLRVFQVKPSDFVKNTVRGNQ